MNKIINIIPILMVISLFPGRLLGQSSDLSYQIILETKGEYNDLDSKSSINPDNLMKINDFNSVSQLYPILKYTNTFKEIVNTRLQIEANIKNYNFDKDSTDFSFQELYTQISLKDKHFFVIGKKRLDWGTGMIWNPTNFFIQKDPLRTQNRLEGIFMLNYNLISEYGSFNVYLFPEKKKEDCSLAVKYDYAGNRIDASLSFLEYGKYQQFGYDFSYGGNTFTLYSEGVLKNFSKSCSIREDGELVMPQSRKKRFRSEFVVGTSIFFNQHVSVSSEYRFREDYLSKKEIGLFKNYLPSNLLLFDPISIGKHTIFNNIEYKDTYGRWSFNARSFYDPGSNQLIISPLAVFTSNNFQIEVSTMFYNNSLAIFNSQSTILLSCFF